MADALGRQVGERRLSEPALAGPSASAGTPGAPRTFGADPREPADPGHPQDTYRRRYLDVAEQILRSLALGSLRAGDRLPDERSLARRFQAARSTVREALLALELSGIVEVRRGAGHYLTGVGLPGRAPAASQVDASPRELLEVRRLLEPPAAHLAAASIRRTEVHHLHGLLDEADVLAPLEDERDLDHFVELNLAFHRELARASGNAVLADVVTHLVDAGEHPLWLLVDRIAVRNAEVRHQQVLEHRQILAAVATGNAQQAYQAMAEHLGQLSARIFGLQDGRPTIHRARPERTSFGPAGPPRQG